MTMQQFISCLLSFEWLEPHPTDWKKLIPTPHVQTYVKSLTQFLNDVLMSGKAEVGRLVFNPVVVAIEQLNNNLVENYHLKENNLHRLYTVPYPVENEVSVRAIGDRGSDRPGKDLKPALSALSSSQSQNSVFITKCVEVYSREFVKESEV